jgi:5-methylcytosine-specific restriction endonuclease McrA
MKLAQNRYYDLVRDKKFPNDQKSSDKARVLRQKIKNLEKKLREEKDHLRQYDIRKSLKESKQLLLSLSASSNEFYDFVVSKNDMRSVVDQSLLSFSKKYEIPSNWTTDFIASSKFLDSFEWKSLRYDALKHYDNLNAKRCMMCNADKVTLNVDHIKPRKFYPHLALDGSNLQILCSSCNHGKSNTTIDHRQKFFSSLIGKHKSV